MAFRIVVAPVAARDIEDTITFISEQSGPEPCRCWKAGLFEAIESLREMPNRYPVISEAEDLGQSLRQCLFHSHRIIYRVSEENGQVDILRVWHGARRRLRSYDFL